MLKSFPYPIFLTALLQITLCQSVSAAYICEINPEHNSETHSIDLPEQDTSHIEPEEPIIIDSDAKAEVTKAEFNWTENTNTDGKIQIDAGGKFPIYMSSSHNSKTAKEGDAVEARLAVDIKIGEHLFAAQGSKINGHIATCKPARKLMQANMSRKRWMRAGGSLGIQFDEIITPDGEHLSLIAIPACQARIVENKAEGRVLGVNVDGEITPPLSAQLKAKSLQSSLQLASIAGGPFTAPAMPIAFGIMGAISPSFAYMHPVGTNVRHRRLKGFAMGAVAGLPAGFLLSDSIIRAPESILNPGDQFFIELKEPFALQTASNSILGAHKQVFGQIIPDTTISPNATVTKDTANTIKNRKPKQTSSAETEDQTCAL